MTKFEKFSERKKNEYGAKFSSENLNPDFIPYFNSGKKIKICTEYNEVKSGYIGVTTGHVPVFLLLERKKDDGSCETIGRDTKVCHNNDL